MSNNNSKDKLDPYKDGETKEKDEDNYDSPSRDVQRAIEDLQDMQEEDFRHCLSDEEFFNGLNVVDAWESDNVVNNDNENSIEKQISSPCDSREHHSKTSGVKRINRDLEESRRDPNKSSKDIERDKLRAKKDIETKLLAEKEKAIRTLLDSDNVLPPGTESEAIQNLVEKQEEQRYKEQSKFSPHPHTKSRGSPRKHQISLTNSPSKQNRSVSPIKKVSLIRKESSDKRKRYSKEKSRDKRESIERRRRLRELRER